MHLQMNSPPAWSMKGRYPRKEERDGPGPGAYRPQGMEYSPSYKIGVGARSDFTYQSKDHPGPGSYSSPKGESGPKFSMRGKYYQASQQGGPGPGAYSQMLNDVTAKERPTSARIGTAKRSDQAVDNVRSGFPGPGSYTAQFQHDGPQWGFGTQQRGNKVNVENPGPGAYQMQSTLSQKAFSMKGRHGQSNADANPGPGAYSAKSQFLQPSYGFGTASRPALSASKDGPGPGTYNQELNEFTAKQRPKSARIGTAPRGGRQPDANPGPGTYTIQPAFSQQAFSMRGRYQQSLGEGAPGPGAYQPTAQSSQPAYGFGTADRAPRGDFAGSPGPGAYNQDLNDFTAKERPKTAKIGTAQRGANQKDANPGPGAYTLKSSLSQQAFSMKGKHWKNSKELSPGPGAYNPKAQQAQHAQPAYGFGSASRSGKAGRKEGPGPGSYNLDINDFNAKERPKTARIGTAQRGTHSNDQNPGPGAYQIGTTLSQQAFSMKGRDKYKGSEATPGPGAYNVNGKQALPAYGFGTAQRNANGGGNANAPGPGAYFPLSHSQSGNIFGKGKRPPLSETQKTPGPGMYDVRGKLIGPHWGFGTQQRGKKNKDEKPGPGSYNIKSSIADVPSYAISQPR